MNRTIEQCPNCGEYFEVDRLRQHMLDDHGDSFPAPTLDEAVDWAIAESWHIRIGETIIAPAEFKTKIIAAYLKARGEAE